MLFVNTNSTYLSLINKQTKFRMLTKTETERSEYYNTQNGLSVTGYAKYSEPSDREPQRMGRRKRLKSRMIKMWNTKQPLFDIEQGNNQIINRKHRVRFWRNVSSGGTSLFEAGENSDPSLNDSSLSIRTSEFSTPTSTDSAFHKHEFEFVQKASTLPSIENLEASTTATGFGPRDNTPRSVRLSWDSPPSGKSAHFGPASHDHLESFRLIDARSNDFNISPKNDARKMPSCSGRILQNCAESATSVNNYRSVTAYSRPSSNATVDPPFSVKKESLKHATANEGAPEKVTSYNYPMRTRIILEEETSQTESYERPPPELIVKVLTPAESMARYSMSPVIQNSQRDVENKDVNEGASRMKMEMEARNSAGKNENISKTWENMHEERWFVKLLKDYCPVRLRKNKRSNFDSDEFHGRQSKMALEKLANQESRCQDKKIIFHPKGRSLFQEEEDILDSIDHFIYCNEGLTPVYKGSRPAARKHFCRRWLNTERDRTIICEFLMQQWYLDKEYLHRLKLGRERRACAHELARTRRGISKVRPPLFDECFPATMSAKEQALKRSTRDEIQVRKLRKEPLFGSPYLEKKKMTVKRWIKDILLGK